MLWSLSLPFRKTMDNNSALVLLDDASSWNSDSRVVVNWSQLVVPQNHESLPLKVEEMASQIKREYLSWVYELGEFKINGKSVVTHLKLFDDFSFWWMTLISEKSSYRCPSIYKVFKLRALEIIYLDRNCKGLVYCGKDLNLHRTLEYWCKAMGHPYRRHSSNPCEKKIGITGVSERAIKFPFWVQAFAYLVRRWFLRFKHLKKLDLPENAESRGERHATIVTYFPNIDLKKTREGHFWSRYWETLHELLERMPIKVNWVWIYTDSKDIDYKETILLQKKCNQTQTKNHRYFLLEEFLSPRDFLKAIKIYISLYLKSLRLKNVYKAFCFQGSNMNFFPMMEFDWKSSLHGHLALDAVMFFLMFDRMAQKLPATHWGLFPMENQPWERALITAWKRYQKNSKTIAFQHSPGVRTLDLRLFFDPELFKKAETHNFPQPDFLAVNGSINRRLIQECGYPQEKLINVEGLRSLQLTGQYGSQKKDLKSSNRTLLVVTGYIDPETEFQLKLLMDASALGGLKSYSKILIKPHPFLPVEGIVEKFHPDFKYEIVHQSMSELWPQADVVYCANSTTVCVEAAWLGFPIIITSPVDAMNLNPLFGISKLRFMANGKILAEELQDPHPIDLPEDYFYLDEKLSLWEGLLARLSSS